MYSTVQITVNYFSMIYGYYDYYYMYIYGTCMSTYLLWKTLCDYFDGTVIVEQYEYEKDFTCFWVCLKFTRTKDFLVIADYKHVINMRAFFYLHIKVLIERHLHNIDFLTAIKVLWIIFVISVALNCCSETYYTYDRQENYHSNFWSL